MYNRLVEGGNSFEGKEITEDLVKISIQDSLFEEP